MKNLKYYIIGAILSISAVNVHAQLFLRYPTNVRFIAGNYNDRRPEFKTLEAALNDVKAYATSSNPYVFWVMSDSLWIADWDSVFTESGLTMKDSIDQFYVSTGKIKWGGFGQGGGGSGGTTLTIIPQDDSTLHYNYPNWNQDNALLYLWQRYMGQALDSVDQHIWDLIVYTDSTYLYIENDTLKFRSAQIPSAHTRPDTTLIAYLAENNTMSGDNTFSGDNTISGSIQYPTANNRTGVARIMWANGNRPYWSGSGAAGDSVQFIVKQTDEYDLELDTVISWVNIKEAVKDSMTSGGIATFSGTNSSLDVTVSGMTSTSTVIGTAIYADSSTAVATQDTFVIIPHTNGFYIKRSLGGTSDLQVAWAWIRKKTF